MNWFEKHGYRDPYPPEPRPYRSEDYLALDEYDDYEEYREPCEWDLFDDDELMGDMI